jgi:transposase
VEENRAMRSGRSSGDSEDRVTVEQLREKAAKIASEMSLAPECEWSTYWRDVMLEVLARPNVEPLEAIWWALAALERVTGNHVALNRRVARQAAERDLDGEALDRCTTPVDIPEREIRVTNPTHRAILYVMGKAGLGRKWRVAERVAELTGVSEGTINNAFTRLLKGGLIARYQYRDKPARYACGRGRRALYVLSGDGLAWYRHNYDEATASELEEAVPRHRGVQHAVDVLEARDLLRDLGLAVDDDPQPLLATEDPWGPRAEPDLVAQYGGAAWPVEVQREVRTRNDEKWGKTLELSGGRLMLVLETEAKRRSQAEILRRAVLDLPPGRILLFSLEGQEGWPGNWEEISTGGD